MAALSTDPVSRRHHLDEVLLGYLVDPHVTVWPGGDGLTLEEALHCYAQAVAADQAPGPQELLTLYPDLAAELADFFASGGL